MWHKVETQPAPDDTRERNKGGILVQAQGLQTLYVNLLYVGYDTYWCKELKPKREKVGICFTNSGAQ